MKKELPPIISQSHNLGYLITQYVLAMTRPIRYIVNLLAYVSSIRRPKVRITPKKFKNNFRVARRAWFYPENQHLPIDDIRP